MAETAVFTRQVQDLLDAESWARDGDTILMLLAYAKADQDDLTTEQLRILRRVVKEEFG